MKKFRKMFALILALMMAFSVTACGGKEAPAETTAAAAVPETTAAPVPETVEEPAETPEETVVLPAETPEVCVEAEAEIPQYDTQYDGDTAEKEDAQDE